MIRTVDFRFVISGNSAVLMWRELFDTIVEYMTPHQAPLH